jgi:hypothetical protein
MIRKRLLLVMGLGSCLYVLAAAPVSAHQPYFEERDIDADNPWHIDDPSISTALYATLDSRGDVDYYTFVGSEQQAVLLKLTIPQITGQEAFAPTMALIGPGLPKADLPGGVAMPEGAGTLVIEPRPGPAATFYEPFSRTSYWERQEQRVTLPASGRYTVAVWNSDAQVGRYTFVIGEKEEFGGDWTFPFKMRQYWTPVEALALEQSGESTVDMRRCARR